LLYGVKIVNFHPFVKFPMAMPDILRNRRFSCLRSRHISLAGRSRVSNAIVIEGLPWVGCLILAIELPAMDTSHSTCTFLSSKGSHKLIQRLTKVIGHGRGICSPGVTARQLASDSIASSAPRNLATNRMLALHRLQPHSSHQQIRRRP
jgi:hypothetical protein